MLGIKFTYKNNRGEDVRIEENIPQHIFLEPKGKVVIRYYFTKENLDVNSTKLISNVLEPHIVSVKVKEPKGKFLSPVSDFNDIPERQDNAEYFEVDFSNSDVAIRDVLFTSLIDTRLKVKVRDGSSKSDSFENENTVTDGPDAFVKLVNVSIKPEHVFYVYVYRRSGRLRKSPNTVSYERLSTIFKSRVFDSKNPDSQLNFSSIVRTLQNNECILDYTGQRISKIVGGKEVVLTDKQIGNYIRTGADARDIINLLKTKNTNPMLHPLINENANYLVSCDQDCSLPEAIPQNSVDERGTL